MLFLKKIYLCIFVTSICYLLNCSAISNPTSPDLNSNENFLYYKVKIAAFNADSITFTLKSNGYNEFILPYLFFDNPVHKLSSPVIKELFIIDDNGHSVNYRSRTEKIGPINNTVISLTGDYQQPVTIIHKINPAAILPDETINLKPIDISDSHLFFLGNAVFIVPFSTTSLVSLWRDPHSISVDIKSKTGSSLYGVPTSGSFRCHNIYELIFCQISSGKEPFLQGYGGGTPFSFINFSDSTMPSDLTPIKNGFSDILDAIWKRYGAFNDNQFTVGISPIGGGLEGTFSFIQIGPSASSFYYVLAHEALHQFVGIRCGEYDDPWWKEGATTYLSYLIAVRLDLYSKDEFRKSMITRFVNADSARFKIALSDQWLRANMFPSGVFGIVYDKGSQVMMLMDYAVRTASANRYSIEDISAYLVKKFDGSAFHRNDFLDAFRRFGNADVKEIFRMYIDSTASPSDSLLKFTFERLDSLGAFGSKVFLQSKLLAESRSSSMPSGYNVNLFSVTNKSRYLHRAFLSPRFKSRLNQT